MEAVAETINAAYSENSQLRKRIYEAINETPQHLQLFHDIAKHQLVRDTPADKSTLGSEHPPLKKRRLDIPNPEDAASTQESSVILEARDLSFSLPQRKKLHLSVVQYGKDFEDPSTTFGLCVRNPATSQVELEVPVESIAYAIRVPIPEKIQKQYNFCFLAPNKAGTAELLKSGEGIIYSVNHGPLKSCHISSQALEAVVGNEDVLESALNAILQRSGNKLLLPSEVEFASAVPESHRKHETAYHVKAHRGSKDGYLFFLGNGIFFGFKKPLAFFPFEEIQSVSYTAVLQRTFNLIVTSQVTSDAEPDEVEFAMLDQADFAGIDEYIKRHGLQDASLADARRAKRFHVNGKAVGSQENADDQSELQKAEAELEDEEDELEEDYDPGSEGDSEGSGTDDDEGEDYDSNAGNIVEEELGSEAEDVSTDEETEEKDVKHSPQVKPEPGKYAPPIPLHFPSMPGFDENDQL